MASLSLELESAEATIARLERELANVSQQCQTSHRMAIFHQREWEKAERLRERAERALRTWRKKLLDQPKGESITHAKLDLWATEDNETTDTHTRHPSLIGSGNHRPDDTVA
jgi:hypothetical protein